MEISDTTEENAIDHAQYISRLISRYGLGTATIEEKVELDNWVQKSDQNRKLFDELKDLQGVADLLHFIPMTEIEDSLARLKGKLSFKPEEQQYEENKSNE